MICYSQDFAIGALIHSEGAYRRKKERRKRTQRRGYYVKVLTFESPSMVSGS